MYCKKNRNCKYNWDKWFVKDHFKLHKGRDYQCMDHCMSVLVRGAAKNRGMVVSVLVQPGSILDVTVLSRPKPVKGRGA